MKMMDMKTIVVLALALSCFQVVFTLEHLKTKTFDLTWNHVEIQEYDLPNDFQGVVTLTVYPLATENVTLCINWLVPAEAPEDVKDLADTWNKTCQFAQVVYAGGKTESFSLLTRTSTNWLSVVLNGDGDDIDSDGESDDNDDNDEVFQFQVDITYSTCYFENTTGPDCDRVTYEEYSRDINSNGTAIYRFPTFVDRENGNTNFLRYLEFQVLASEDEEEDDETRIDADSVVVSYRLNGPVTVGYDGVCTELSTCTIPNPPMNTVDDFDFYWEIKVDAVATFQIVPKYCDSNDQIGADCKSKYTVFDSAPGTVKTYTGPLNFTFSGPVLNVAVGGVDGYTQLDLAPFIYVQLDAAPDSLILSSGIDSKANRLSFSLEGIATADSRFVVFVKADKKTTYGVWIPTNTSQCPDSCSNHGTCTDYVCECDGGKYNGLACEHEVKNFTIEYIILIAVGGLLVLSIVIGVPIYCWMNRQQDYETIE